MRLERLDIIRGIAIFLMVIFHLNYSLVNIFNSQILELPANIWFYIWRISALLFIIIAGISFVLAENKYKIKIIKKYIKVSIFLWIIAFFISLSTLLFFPEQYIRFWIIHFFSLSFLLLLLFRKFKYYNIILWLWIIIYGFYFISIVEVKYLYFLGFVYPWFNSADFYPILPYFWVMLLWYWIWTYLLNNNLLHILRWSSISNIFKKFFIYIWKKSLLIYIIHQPIIIGVLYLFF